MPSDININAGRDVTTGDVVAGNQTKIATEDPASIYEQARELLVEDNLPFLQRKYAEQIIGKFEKEATSVKPQRSRLQEIADGLARYAPQAAEVLATLIPAVVKAAGG